MTYHSTIYRGLTYAQSYTLGGRLEFYRQRQEGRLTFLRLALRRGPMLVLHLGTTNYGWRTKGWEVDTHLVHAGWIADRRDLRWFTTPKWSGSQVDPWHSVTVRLGRLFVGCRAPEWLQRIKRRRVERDYLDWVDSLPDSDMYHEEN